MRSLIASLLFMLVALSAFAGNPTPVPGYELSMEAQGEIVIAPDGTVKEHSLDVGLAASVKALIDKSVRSWRFEPILIDGRAVTAKTRMNLALDAVPTADGSYSLTLRHAWFGVPTRSKNQRPPGYPRRALSEGLEARVLLVAKLDAQGRVVAVHPYQTSLSRLIKYEPRAQGWRKQFERVCIRAMMKWKFTPGETIDGIAMGGYISVPIEFTQFEYTRDGASQRWRAYFPGPISPVPSLDEATAARLEPDALDDGDIGPLDSRFKLASNVIGKAL